MTTHSGWQSKSCQRGRGGVSGRRTARIVRGVPERRIESSVGPPERPGTLEVISQSSFTRSPGRNSTVPSSPIGTPSMAVSTSSTLSAWGSALGGSSAAAVAVEERLLRRGAREESGLTAEITTPVVPSGTRRYRRSPRFSRCSNRNGTSMRSCLIGAGNASASAAAPVGRVRGVAGAAAAVATRKLRAREAGMM